MSTPLETVTADLRLLVLPTLDALAAHHDRDPDAVRRLVVVGLTGADGVSGWGECSALNRPTYTSEWADDSFELLASGEPPGPSHPMTAAAIEMAVLDRHLRRGERSLAPHLGATAATVTAGATVGLGSAAALRSSVQRLAAAGYRRLKVKVSTGQVRAIVADVADAAPGIEIQIDGNGGLSAVDLDDLVSVAAMGVTAIEQPFAPEDLATAATLVTASPIPVMADEAAPTLADARRVRAAGALSGVAIKPPRLGGLAPALEMLAWCHEEGLAATAGGMLESGLGRHALAAFAALGGLTLTGDLSPARRWLAADPWPDLDMVDGDITVPDAPGVAPLPDRELLERYTERHASIDLAITSAT